MDNAAGLGCGTPCLTAATIVAQPDKAVSEVARTDAPLAHHALQAQHCPFWTLISSVVVSPSRTRAKRPPTGRRITIEAVITWLDAGQPDPDQAAKRIEQVVHGVIQAAQPG